jgi:hypothetical protein
MKKFKTLYFKTKQILLWKNIFWDIYIILY